MKDKDLLKIHHELLRSQRLDHMVFVTGPKTEERKQQMIEEDIAKSEKEGKEYKEIQYVTDGDIEELLASTGCTVRKIVHRETTRDVYFWMPDNLARDKALDKAYKLKGIYAAEKKSLTIEPINQELKEKINSILDGILTSN